MAVTVTAATTDELRAERDRIQDADLVELRLDTVRDPDVAGALAGRTKPVIVTCRASWEGGHFQGSEADRKRILAEALDRGAEYVDVEWRATFLDLLSKTNGQRIVLSSHDFEGVPADLASRAAAMRATGAEVIKVAVKATRLSDCLRLKGLAGDGPAVLIAMGEPGLATRVLAERFGSAWTYAGTLRGVGQISARTLVHDYRFRSISDRTTVFGITGSPVSHSVSPAMHNAAYRALGMDAVYVPLPATDADDFLAFADAIGLQGASVTIPFKVDMRARMDVVDDQVERVGALNTIRFNVKGREGRNTDVPGFLAPLLAARVTLADARVAILGTGGSARAVAVALAAHGAAVTVYGRDRRRAETIAALASGIAGDWPPPVGSWEILVNCTPIGMSPRVDETPLAASLLSGRGLVYDLVYNPSPTRLLRDAAAAGCSTIGGLDMLVAQAAEQFAWWTGRQAPVDIMRAAAETRLREFMTDEAHVV